MTDSNQPFIFRPGVLSIEETYLEIKAALSELATLHAHFQIERIPQISLVGTQVSGKTTLIVSILESVVGPKVCAVREAAADMGELHWDFGAPEFQPAVTLVQIKRRIEAMSRMIDEGEGVLLLDRDLLCNVAFTVELGHDTSGPLWEVFRMYYQYYRPNLVFRANPDDINFEEVGTRYWSDGDGYRTAAKLRQDIHNAYSVAANLMGVFDMDSISGTVEERTQHMVEYIEQLLSETTREVRNDLPHLR